MKILKLITFLFLIIAHSKVIPQSYITKSDSLTGDYFFNLAEKFFTNNEFDSSSIYYLKAANLYGEEDEWKSHLAAINYSALDFVYLSKHETGTNLLQDGLVVAIEKFGVYDSLTAVLFNSLGSAYYTQSNFRDALQSYDLSLQIKQRIFGSNHTETAFGYHNTGLVWYFMGDYQKALEHFNRALATWLPLHGNSTSSIGNCYINIANVYAAIENYDKSIEFDLKALETWKSVLGEDHRYIAMSYNNLAESYETIGNYSKAFQYANKSLELNIKIFGSNHPQVASNKTLIAKIYRNSGDLAKAGNHINEALAIWDDYPTDKKRNETLFQLADLNIRINKFSDALANYDSIIITILPEILENYYLPEESFNLPIIKVSYLYAVAGKGDVYFKRYKYGGKNIGDLEDAYNWYELYSKILNQIRKSYRRENSKLNLSKEVHKNDAKLVETIYELFKLTKNDKYKILAYSISSNSKAAALSDAIVESGAKEFSNIPDSLLKKENKLQKELESYYNKLAYAEDEGLELDKISDIQKKIFEINKTYDELIKSFEKDYPVYFNLKYENKITNIKDIQSGILDTNSVLIEYFISDSSIFIFAISNEDIEIKKLILPDLSTLVNSFRSSLQNLEFEEYITAAYRLYESLIFPVSNNLMNREKIFIIPDGILNYLPFEALISKKYNLDFSVNFSDLEYLINNYEIVYQYTANLLINSNDNQLPSKFSFAGLAPVFEETKPDIIEGLIDTSLISTVQTRSIEVRKKIYSALPYSEKEVKEIAALFNKYDYKSITFLRSEAKEEIIKHNTINKYNIVHIASHGFINEKRPKLSGILFWKSDSNSNEDAILHLGEIFNLNLDADLIVLSACESGLGKLVSGEGIIGLTRGFIYAGVENVVISLWQVADQSTSQLMVDFYKFLLDGNSYSQSLRLAKLKMISEKVFAYPLEWSPFILIGN